MLRALRDCEARVAAGEPEAVRARLAALRRGLEEKLRGCRGDAVEGARAARAEALARACLSARQRASALQARLDGAESRVDALRARAAQLAAAEDAARRGAVGRALEGALLLLENAAVSGDPPFAHLKARLEPACRTAARVAALVPPHLARVRDLVRTVDAERNRGQVVVVSPAGPVAPPCRIFFFFFFF